ncbi:hypothetical protein Acy02nite_82010 [Actinoplanes cyaneus]|uniref:Uncharacterized protein n=1 Tax=Actinoplanes cyaneus TaxID=52696 RepID=A0A919IQF8_9ACTN|nr:hypothetical protein Acy02nite_82010 [Actinoplanes cyaneus]
MSVSSTAQPKAFQSLKPIGGVAARAARGVPGEDADADAGLGVSKRLKLWVSMGGGRVCG